MFLLGLFVGMFCFVACFIEWSSEMEFTKTARNLLVCGVLGIALFGWDVQSPVVEEVSYIQTNDYSKYGVRVESDRLGVVKLTSKDATRFGAVFNDENKYRFIEFVEEE